MSNNTKPRAAIYARFSSDRQNETSIEAQQRLCRARADALGAVVVALHSDLAVSGSVPVERRPGGRALLADALASRFDVLVLEGLDRLSRDQVESETIVRRLEHRGIRIVGTSDGYDTASGKGRKILRGVRGLLNEVYLDDLREKVHRTLAAKASRGCHVAGLSYGYASEQAGNDRRLVIVPEQATVVGEIFDRYGAGESCAKIAADLNARRVTGPRGNTWSVSALYGSPAKGAGVLNNELYVGRVVWNRSQWIKDPDTGKRVRMVRPRHEWQTAEQPDLRIVSDAVFAAVRARIGRTVGKGQGGPMPRTLFGGILRCGLCAGSMVKVDPYTYGCAARKDRGATVCKGTRVKVRDADGQLLAAIRSELAGPAAIAQVRTEAAQALAAHRDDGDAVRGRLATLEREIRNLVDALATFGMSDAVRTRLQSAEAERAELLARPKRAGLPTVDEIVASYRASLLRLEERLTGEVDRARLALADLLGNVTVHATDEGTFADVETRRDRVLMVAGASKMGSVAGEGLRTHRRFALDERARTSAARARRGVA